jgi:hypothetical protein
MFAYEHRHICFVKASCSTHFSTFWPSLATMLNICLPSISCQSGGKMAQPLSWLEVWVTTSGYIAQPCQMRNTHTLAV